jgi:hypothetical protein
MNRLLAAAALGLAFPAAPAAADLPTPVLPDGLGVNIHFTDPRAGEMAMLAGAGLRWIRMDFGWGGTEREKGKYDFSAYDRLLDALKPHGLRTLFILDYGNRHYDGGESPRSEEARQAMARWAAEAVRRFQGRGILWEMWNEPNIGFWKPKPNADDYVKLALAVGRAIREAAPGETYIGPATSGVDLPFLETCFKGGLLAHWTAVSVHPYRQVPPETAADDYRRLRRLIARYAPAGKKIPILSGEWGYSAAWGGMNEDKQGLMLPRQWLTNVSNDVPLSIWYDWHDDGTDPKEPEHHFGTVSFPYRGGRDPVYDPKPAWRAAKALTSSLDGFRFSKRLALSRPDDYALLFAKENDVRLAAWTTSPEPHPATIPASPGAFRVTGHLGEALPAASADAKGLSVTLTQAPQYFAPEGPNDLLRVAAAWDRLPLEIITPLEAPARLGLRNPLSKAIRIRTGPSSVSTADAGGAATAPLPLPAEILRNPEPVPLRIEWEIEGMGRLAQETVLLARSPLRLTALPRAGTVLPLRVENPSGEAFRGKVRLTDLDGVKSASPEAALEFKAGETEKVVKVAVEAGGAADYRLKALVEDEQGRVVLRNPSMRFVEAADLLRPEDGRIVPDGDAKVASEQSAASGAPPEGPPLPGLGTLRITYRFDEGWKFIRLTPKAEKAIDGKPKAFGLWVYGDGEGNSPRLRFLDSTGQCFQPSAASIDWKGWRYLAFPMDGSEAGHWGGANDGAVHPPIRWDSIFLLDGRRQKTQGTVYLAGPTLVYD